MQKIKEDLYAIFIPSSEKQRFLLCLNTQKREDDWQYRKSLIESIKEELDKLNAGLGRNKNIKTRDEAMRRAGTISKRNYSGKYFAIKTVDSTKNPLGFELKYELKTEKIKDDEMLDGTFLIQTNEEKYSNEKLLEIYKNLSKVENAFRIIKFVQGLYESDSSEPLVTYGHLKDHRPDLKQIKLGTAVTRHGLPVTGELLPGNKSDQVWNVEAIKQTKTYFDAEGLSRYHFHRRQRYLSGPGLYQKL